VNWGSWSAFWDMGGRGLFVWGSYGALLIMVITELAALRHTRKAALRALQEDHDS